MLKKYANWLTVLTLVIAGLGSFMIASANMSSSFYSLEILTKNIGKQIIIVLIGVFAFIVLRKFTLITLKLSLFYFLYVIVLLALLSTRLFGPINGAYAWIRIGGFSLQPSELAKLFIIYSGTKIFGFNRGNDNIILQRHFLIGAFIFFAVIGPVQGDYGSALVVAAIAYGITMTSSQYETRGTRVWLSLLFILLIILLLFVLSPTVTNYLEEHFGDNYIVARIISSANPFKDRYNTGYHLTMSLITFATGGWFGLGYGQSIHKYMNFPSPSSDFILPVIVEEMGFVGFIFFIIIYGGMMYSLIRSAYIAKNSATRIACVGTYLYLTVHFVLNVGGVSGLIPLTGVPLLLLSSGGSSVICFMACVGICVCLLRKEDEDENNSRKV